MGFKWVNRFYMPNPIMPTPNPPISHPWRKDKTKMKKFIGTKLTLITVSNRLSRIIIELFYWMPQITTRVQHPSFFFWSTWTNVRNRIGQTVLTSSTIHKFPTLSVGMATVRVQAGFFHTRTRPVGLSQKPWFDSFIIRIFFLTPNPARQAPASLASHAPIWA